MKTSFARTAVALAISLAAARAQQTTAADPIARAHQDIASLIPADTVAVARVASIDQLVQHAVDLTNAAGEDASRVTAERLLERAGPMLGKRELIDRKLPVVIALSLPRATPPSPVLLVPATDPAAYAASFQGLAVPPVVSGSYVAVPLGPRYEKPAEPSTALADLPAGTFAAHADVEKLAAAFGKAIGAALSGAKAGFAEQLERNSPGLDGEALADLYIEGVRTVLGCAKTCRLSVDYRDGTLDLFATLQVKPDSDMDGWSSAPLDAAALGGPPTGTGAVEVLMAADWKKLWPRFLPMVDALADVYPKATGDVIRKAAVDWAPLYGSLGPVVAADGDLLAAGGVSMAMRVATPDAAEMRKQVEAMIAKGTYTEAGVTFAAPRTTEASGATITDREVTFDFTKLGDLLDLQLTGMGNVTNEQVLQALFGGPSIPLRIATKGERGLFVIGKQPDDVTMAVLDGPARAWSKPVQQALARVADCNPLVVERIDGVALIAAFARLARQLDETSRAPEIPAGATGNFVFSGGVRGAEWRAGLSMDLAGFVKVIRAQGPR